MGHVYINNRYTNTFSVFLFALNSWNKNKDQYLSKLILKTYLE